MCGNHIIHVVYVFTDHICENYEYQYFTPEKHENHRSSSCTKILNHELPWKSVRLDMENRWLDMKNVNFSQWFFSTFEHEKCTKIIHFMFYAGRFVFVLSWLSWFSWFSHCFPGLDFCSAFSLCFHGFMFFVNFMVFMKFMNFIGSWNSRIICFHEIHEFSCFSWNSWISCFHEIHEFHVFLIFLSFTFRGFHVSSVPMVFICFHDMLIFSWDLNHDDGIEIISLYIWFSDSYMIFSSSRPIFLSLARFDSNYGETSSSSG